MIGRCEIEFHQFKDRLEKSLSLPTGQSVNGLDCGHSLNRQVGISWRGSGLSGQFIGRPIRDGFGTDPDGESSPLFERGVILAPVADVVRGSLFHRKKSIPRHCIRNSSLRFVQQSHVDLEAKLMEWETFYNCHRPHASLKGKTHYEILLEKLQSNPTSIEVVSSTA